jgi:hypothetical protein
MNYKTVFTVLMFFSLTVFAGVGGVDGGGGKSIVCRDSAGQITSAEVLDLYEARMMFGRTLRTPVGTMQGQLQDALKVIPEPNRHMIETLISSVQSKMKMVPVGTKLNLIDDAMEVMLPVGNCSAEQAANYFNENLIMVSEDIWNHLDEMNRAALLMHEALYRYNRFDGASDSRRTRYAVGAIFSEGTQWVPIQDQVPEGAAECSTPDHEIVFWLYQDNNKDWVLQFRKLGSGEILTKTWGTAGHDYTDFADAINEPLVPANLAREIIELTVMTNSALDAGDTIGIYKELNDAKDRQGQVIPGMKMPQYFISWKSATFPKLSVAKLPFSCFTPN